MKNTLKWRLGKLPTSEEVLELVKASLITKEEARNILFNLETDEERDKKSLESEIKFLRDLVEKLSDNKMSRIVEVVKQYQPIYIKDPWYQPYYTWCSTAGNTAYVTGSITAGSNTAQTLTSTATSLASGTNALYVGNQLGAVTASSAPSFSSIKTF